MFTVKEVQEFLNNGVRMGEKQDFAGHKGSGWFHEGKSRYWTHLTVEGSLSDLVGYGMVESVKATKGVARIYKPRPIESGLPVIVKIP